MRETWSQLSFQMTNSFLNVCFPIQRKQSNWENRDATSLSTTNTTTFNSHVTFITRRTEVDLRYPLTSNRTTNKTNNRTILWHSGKRLGKTDGSYFAPGLKKCSRQHTVGDYISWPKDGPGSGTSCLWYEHCSYSYLPHEKSLTLFLCSGVKYWVETLWKIDHWESEIFWKHVRLD